MMLAHVEQMLMTTDTLDTMVDYRSCNPTQGSKTAISPDHNQPSYVEINTIWDILCLCLEWIAHMEFGIGLITRKDCERFIKRLCLNLKTPSNA